MQKGEGGDGGGMILSALSTVLPVLCMRGWSALTQLHCSAPAVSQLCSMEFQLSSLSTAVRKGQSKTEGPQSLKWVAEKVAEGLWELLDIACLFSLMIPLFSENHIRD